MMARCFALAETLNDGDEIGEALTDARARLDRQVAALREGALNRPGHLDLLRTQLEAGHGRGDRPMLAPELWYVYAVFVLCHFRKSRTPQWVDTTGTAGILQVQESCRQGNCT